MTRAPAMSDSPAIEFSQVWYRTRDNHVLLSELNLDIRSGEVLMLLGPSGSGKTTSLKLINSLLSPSQGKVTVAGRSTRDWNLIHLRRGIGYAIQEGGLFPHYTVWKNVALVPKLQGWTVDRITIRVREVLNMVGLSPDEFSGRYPDQLSGGQRQRVGLARALAADPPILLMDEPFGALDPITRSEIQQEFKQLQQRLHKTVVFVTHDVSEALMLGERIALMDTGTLRGVYTPHEFLNSNDPSAKPYVSAFRTTQQMFRS